MAINFRCNIQSTIEAQIKKIMWKKWSTTHWTITYSEGGNRWRRRSPAPNLLHEISHKRTVVNLFLAAWSTEGEWWIHFLRHGGGDRLDRFTGWRIVFVIDIKDRSVTFQLQLVFCIPNQQVRIVFKFFVLYHRINNQNHRRQFLCANSTVFSSANN